VTRLAWLSALLVVLAALLQVTLVPLVMPGAARPDGVLVLATLAGFMGGSRYGLVMGMAGGLLLDLVTGRFLGLHLLIKGAAGAVGGQSARHVYRENAPVALLMVALTLFIQYSRMGRACRACAQDMGMSNLLGIDTNRVISFTFMLGAILAAVGGMLIGLSVGRLSPFIGFIAGLKAFTAAVLGGIGSIPGAMLGGIVLGLAETFAAGYMPSQYKDVVAFSLLVLVLLFWPTGLLGKSRLEKV